MKMAKRILAGTVLTSFLALQATDSSGQNGPSVKATSTDVIRPFKVHFPDTELSQLRERILTTRWPEKETVADQSQGVPLAAIQQLAHYWTTDYDWRKMETKLNALPQFITNIDGLDIHFI